MNGYGTIFYRMALANLLFFLGNSLFILFPVFLKGLGASEKYIGFSNNIDKAFIIIIAAFTGRLVRWRNHITLFRAGLVILVCTFALYLLISGLSWAIIIIRMAHGIGFSLAVIMGTTIIFDSVPFERATEAIGIYGVTGALSNALSPFLGEMLLTAGFTHYTLFFISTVFASASLIATIGLAADTAAVKDYVGTSESKNTLFNSRMLALMAISLIFGGMFGVMVTYLPNYVRSVSGYRYSTFFISYIAALVTIRFGFLGRINQIDKTRVIMFVFAAGALSHLLLHFLISWTMLVAVGVLYGIMHGFLYPTLNTAAIALAPCEKSAAANALYTAVFNSGIMIFTIATGFLIDATGAYLSAFYLCGFTGLTAVVITIFFSKRGMLEPFKSQ